MHSQGLQVQGAAVYSYIPPQYHLLAATLLLLAGSACTAHFCMYALSLAVHMRKCACTLAVLYDCHCGPATCLELDYCAG